MKTPALPRTLRRRQLDRAFQSGATLRTVTASLPRHGWIREIRNALGMSAAHLAARMGVSQPNVAKLEKSEAAGTISIQSLRRAAEALDCTLVYALVPRRSLEEFLTEHATQVAARQIRRVSHTMALEEQAIDSERLQEQIADLAAELIRTLSADLWSEKESVTR